MQGEIYINENSVHYKFKSKYLRFKEDINNLINKIYVIQVYILKIWTALFFQVTKEHTAQLVKNPPAMWETPIQSLGREDPLEKVQATHSSILPWRIPIVHGFAMSLTRLSEFHFPF